MSLIYELYRMAVRSAALCGVVLLNSGCAALVSNAASGFADNLSAAVVNQNDPDTVRDGAPAYMLLLDSLIEGNPEDPGILAAAANLYASYGAVFADDPARAARLTERARHYATDALCLSFAPSCLWEGQAYEEFEQSLSRLNGKHEDALYAYGVASLAYIRAHSDDWAALARLPHMEALLNRYLEISDGEAAGTIYTYLGILVTLRPPALGGQPEKGQRYFQQAIELSGGSDLSAKVEYARGYARPLYERELHDRLLQEVLAADPEVPGYTLTNVLAQRDAADLLATADDYF
jgi:hypothetical protein